VPKTKTAIVTVSVVEVACPDCKAPMGNPATGSHLWGLADKYDVDTMPCYSCGAMVAIPSLDDGIPNRLRKRKKPTS
jgi:NMD protein affecting ribosome stability and mRNA decay